MNKKALTETDICDQFITPSIVQAGWDKTTQIRREHFFTAGKVRVRGKVASRGKRKFADYVLFFQSNLPIAIIEAKDNNQPVGGGMGQAIDYAVTLDVPFVFSSNGDGFVFHDRTGLSAPKEQELTLGQFPSPSTLWAKYRAWKGLDDEKDKLVRYPYFDAGDGHELRYYQRIAVQRVVEAVARGDRRMLLTMATGSGKTFTAFHIIWRLWKAGVVKRVLFLADRDALLGQTKTGDFKPFGKAMTRVKNRTVDTAYEVYLALYQAVSGTEEEDNIYKQFSPGFFDLIVIDECHRGSARDDSAWREILTYFNPAIHMGMTATPKETETVSTLTYFGDAIYTYSLKQGIDDGYLAPYKVVRIDIDRDLQGWRPSEGMVDDLGELIEDRIYNQRDMDKVLVLNQRTKLVAAKVVAYLLATDPYGKTIVFCEDIEHAERMRSALVNEVALRMPHEAQNHKFVVRMTGDSEDGKRYLDDFQHPERKYPVIATTSKLLSTGVDIKTCKVIVIDQRIESMIEFKQTIGRGTRILEDAGKLWFTIMDFKKATELFADPDFDGDPVVVYVPQPDDPIEPPDEPDGEDDGGNDGDPDLPPVGPGPGPEPGGRQKFYVGGVTVTVLAERVQYMGKDGKLITESLTDYTKHTVQEQYATLGDFLKRWSSGDKKQVIIDELQDQGVLIDNLREQVGKDLDPFDLICHVVYDRPALTRRERAESVKKRDVFTKYGDKARAVLDALLEKYANEGVIPADDVAVLRVQPLAAMGTLVELVDRFGGKDGYFTAIHELEEALYGTAA